MNSDGMLEAIFTEQEFKDLSSIKGKDRSHPVRWLIDIAREAKSGDYLRSNEFGQQILVNTEGAIKSIEIAGHDDWVQKQKSRLLEKKDFSTPSAALAEIRAFGNLLSTGLKVTPLRTGDRPTPDFKVEGRDGDKIFVEVFAKQMQGKEAKDLEDFNHGKPSSSGRKGAHIREHVVTPFGKPKCELSDHNFPIPVETVTENAISKLAQIKEAQHQASLTNPTLLWVDFQDEIWQLAHHAESVFPLLSWHGELTSGSLFYAYYGWKGAPIFELHAVEERISSPPKPMRHHGQFGGPGLMNDIRRFVDRLRGKPKSRFDAVVVSFYRTIAILENPYSRKPIPNKLWRHLTHLPWFSIEHSYLDWPQKGSLKRRLEIERQRLEAMAKVAIYQW